MMADKSLPVKKRRRRGEKSKTGCQTCRIRRVKCDESRPFCFRCTSTGRICEGPVSYEYSFIQDDSFQTASSCPFTSAIRSPIGTSHFRGSERRSFEFFLLRAAPALSAALDPYFWEYIVPQLSQSEPVIRNAVLAISSLFEHPRSSIPSADKAKLQPVSDPNNRQALYWYNAAINCFNGHMQHTPPSTSVALISCILFICIELQQDGFANALTLLEKGLALHSTSADAIGATYEGMSAVDETITQFFSRLAFLASVFGREPPSSWFVNELNAQALQTSLSSFQTLQEARFLLYILKDQCHAFLREANAHITQSSQSSSDLTTRQQDLISKLTEWYAAFEKIESTTPETIAASSRLSMICDSIYIWVATQLNPSQTAFDEHCSRFESIVNRAEVALEADRTDAPFTFDVGLILPLHFTAVKCRQPLLRRRALSLLRRCPAKECWWKALPHAWIAEKTIEVEEQRNGRLMEFPGAYGRESEGEALIFESKRVYHLEVVDESMPGCKLKFVPRPGRYLDMSS